MILRGKEQRIIQIIGLFGLILGIRTMLRTPTLILPPWFLVLLFLPILLGASFLLGLATTHLIRSNWSKLTFTAMFTGLLCVVFYISEYKPTLKIIVTDSFSGEVKLLLSRDSKDKFELNENGIG
jgi:heme/copper-type cytochrome/quinol oxidase subunit 3